MPLPYRVLYLWSQFIVRNGLPHGEVCGKLIMLGFEDVVPSDYSQPHFAPRLNV